MRLPGAAQSRDAGGRERAAQSGPALDDRVRNVSLVMTTPTENSMNHPPAPESVWRRGGAAGGGRGVSCAASLASPAHCDSRTRDKGGRHRPTVLLAGDEEDAGGVRKEREGVRVCGGGGARKYGMHREGKEGV
ncbi:hypothetical protein E2C01_078160 [Portunus trituberculatus]|uniref:Uncharacterized protein n=1 Tax=Portunus trituberculatus TaxID=210409 RepID=A0A5B7IN47_PORTR|nr:hypothetical protein [Portunus trituberculatus]